MCNILRIKRERIAVKIHLESGCAELPKGSMIIGDNAPVAIKPFQYIVRKRDEEEEMEPHTRQNVVRVKSSCLEHEAREGHGRIYGPITIWRPLAPIPEEDAADNCTEHVDCNNPMAILRPSYAQEAPRTWEDLGRWLAEERAQQNRVWDKTISEIMAEQSKKQPYNRHTQTCNYLKSRVVDRCDSLETKESRGGPRNPCVKLPEHHLKLETKAKLVPSAFLREVRSRALLSKLTGKPYVPLRNGTLDPKVCGNCLLQQMSMKHCAGCKTVYYCCIRCQRTHWALHKLSCNPDACLPLGTNGIRYGVNLHADPQCSAGRVASRSASNISVGCERSEHRWNPI